MHEKTNINAVKDPSSLNVAEIADETQVPVGFWQRPLARQFVSFFSQIVYRVDRIFGDLIAIALGLGICGLWIATSVLEKQSTDLTVLRPNIKMWFAEAFDGRNTEFDHLELVWLPTSNNFVVAIEGAEIRGSDDEVLEKFDFVRATFAPSADMLSAPRLINAQVKGGALTYLEDAQGQIVAGLGLPDKVGSIEPVYRSGETRNNKFDLNTMLQGFEFIEIEDALLCIRSEKLELDFNSDVERLHVIFSDTGSLSLTAKGTVKQASKPMPFTIASLTDTNFEAIQLRMKVTGARFDEIGPKKGRFWEFRGLAAPLNMTTEIDFSRRDGLRAASVDVDIGKGKLAVLRDDDFQDFQIDSLIARASLKPGDERMDVTKLDLKAPNLSFKSSGFLSKLGNLNDGDANSSPIFNLSARDIQANMTPTFPVETKIDGLNVEGQIDVDTRKLEISKGRMEVYNTSHAFNGEMLLQNDNTMKSLKLKSSMSGVLSPQQFLEFWPVKAFEGARDWIDVAVLQANMTQLDVELDFDEDFFESRALTEERLKFYFAGKDTSVKYLQSLPPATHISGRGEIIGNELRVFLDNGQVNEISLTGGLVEIPKLRPKYGDINISIDGQGGLSEFLHLANYPPYEIAKRYNVDPNTVSGEGDVTVKVTRKLIPFLPADQVGYQINGDFRGASAPFDLGEFKIANGNLSLDANRDRVIIAGPVDVGPWRVESRWFETLGENAPPTKYSARGSVDANLLDSLGLASRTWFDGSAFVQIEGEGRGFDVLSGAVNVDLTNASLSQERVWTKPVGEPAALSGQLSRTLDDGYFINNAQLNGVGLNLLGQIDLDKDYRFRKATFSDVSIDRLINGKVTVTSDQQAKRLDVQLDANYLNLSSWTEDLFAERRSNLDVPLSLRGNVANLVLDENYVVTNSQIDFAHTGEVIETARLEALTDGKPLKLELSTRDDLNRQFFAEVPDASKAVAAFMGLDNTSGGRLEIEANLPAAGEEGAYVGTADMRDFRLKEAPALAQLLSLASLTGLADTLSSGSMQFEKFKVPFTLFGDDIAIRDARLYGPALGMTADGDINLERRVVDFDGTLVPAYTANSVLGDIPILGDIFVQEKDGGLFALTYKVNGPFEQTQISVNPLSALTPGFLRGIFKRDRSDIDDAMKEAIRDVSPPPIEKP